MTPLGVKYFSPISVYTSPFHSNILFVQNIDRVHIIAINA
jgi:hypothetical protein